MKTKIILLSAVLYSLVAQAQDSKPDTSHMQQLDSKKVEKFNVRQNEVQKGIKNSHSAFANSSPEAQMAILDAAKKQKNPTLTKNLEDSQKFRLLPGDQILEIDGKKIKSAEEAMDAYNKSKRPGRHSMTVLRKGEIKSGVIEVK